MAKNTYQSYTPDTPIHVYRGDFVHRGAICAALTPRFPELASVAADANAIVIQIDARLAALQHAEDDQIRAGAIEDAEKIDVADVYTELRRTMFARNYDVATILPEAPSNLRRLGAERFADRVNAAMSNLKTLPETDPVRVAFLASLEKEFAEFNTADKAEDDKRASLKSGNVALTLYKSELAQAREAQLGSILVTLKDREKVAMCTRPWRKPARNTNNDET